MRIGNGCGFWGDNLDAPILLARQGNLDYLTLEYLAELTMSILALQKQKDPDAGFAGDFLDVLERLCPVLESQPQLNIVTNAGGMNPRACARRAQEILRKHGLKRPHRRRRRRRPVAAAWMTLLAQVQTFANLDTGELLANDPAARRQRQRLSGRAGRLPRRLARAPTSSSPAGSPMPALTVGPAMHEFGWAWRGLGPAGRGDRCRPSDRMRRPGRPAACGAIGGKRPNLGDVGYPFVDLEPDGSFVIVQAGMAAAARQPRNRQRTTAVRGRRSRRLSHAGRRRRFHERDT